MSAVLLVEQPAPGVALVTLNRPEAHNALSLALHAELDGTLGDLERDDGVRAIVLTGAGSKAFSAGYDVREMADWDTDTALLRYAEREPWMWHVASCTTPIVAAVNGFAYGGGAVVAIACDIRVGCPNTRFKVTAANYGGVNASWSLPPIVGIGLAKEWLMTGRVVEATEAYHAGLLNHLVPVDQLLDKAMEIASAIAANPPDGTQAVKAMIHDHIGRRYQDAQRAETNLMTTVLRPGHVGTLFADFLSTRS